MQKSYFYFFFLLEQPSIIYIPCVHAKNMNQTSEEHLLGVFDFLFEGGREDDLCPQGELYRFGLCWSLPFSGDRLAMQEVSTNPTV